MIANPPYVEPDEVAGLPPEVRAEPPLALVGGVPIYRRLFEDAGAWVRPGGSVVVEIGETQGPAVAAAATSAGLASARDPARPHGPRPRGRRPAAVTSAIEDAVGAALRGELIVMPTDTVYGIGARPDRPDATARLFAAKGRPRELDLPVLAPSPASAAEVGRFDERATRVAASLWPGALTLVLPRTDESRSWDLGGDPETIGVRVPDHPLALAVLTGTGPLAVTSANRSGDPTPARCAELEEVFGDDVAVYLCEEAPLSGAASTVLDLAHGEPRILRAGAIGEHVLAAILGG